MFQGFQNMMVKHIVEIKYTNAKKKLIYKNAGIS